MRLGLLGTVPGINPRVRPELHSDLPVGTELSAWPSRVGAFPSTPVERTMQAIGHLEAGLRAAAAGVDALAIDSLGDYGLDALRSGLAIPVVGAGEAGISAAACHGRFAIVTVWPRSMNFVPEELLAAQGQTDRCVGIYNVGEEGDVEQVSGPDGYLARINGVDETILGRVLASIDQAVAKGAEAILLGCTCMSPMAASISSKAPVPIVNPLAEAAKRAADLAVRQSRPAEAIVTTRAPVITRMVDAIAGEADENCPVCVIGEMFGEDE